MSERIGGRPYVPPPVWREDDEIAGLLRDLGVEEIGIMERVAVAARFQKAEAAAYHRASKEESAKTAKRDRSLIARIAGNVASGLTGKDEDGSQFTNLGIAHEAVSIALAILAKTDERLAEKP